MKRLVLASLTLLLAAASAGAQGLTMGTMNGWTFTFSGNVNAFIVYTDPKCSDGSPSCDFLGSTIPTGQEEKVLRIRTGLAPAFAIFEAKGKEGNFDIGVHFGFAPEIQTSFQLHDNCGGGYGGCGSQIDMREAYLTFGGNWGQILAGRAIGVYQQQNLLTDMTVFGVGLSGGGGGKVAGGNGTTLGHIGTGYTYPNFNAQVTYSTPANKPGVFTIGLFDPSIIYADENFSQCCFDVTRSPRLEASFEWTKHTGAAGSADKFMWYVSGLLANNKNDGSGTCYPGPFNCKSSISPWGLAGGVEWNGGGGWQADVSGFTQKGVGTTLMFDDGLAVDAAGNGRSSYGYLLQLQYAMKNNMWKFGASYGLNHLSQTSNDTDGSVCDGDCPFVKTNSSVVGAVTYMFTKSLRGVFEYTYGSSVQQDGDKITSSQVASGLMLFF